MVGQIADLPLHRPHLLVRYSIPLDGQVQSGRNDHQAGGAKPEKSLDEQIRHPVILRPADPVNEQVAQRQAGPKRRDERRERIRTPPPWSSNSRSTVRPA